jgi:hypothetical protein
MFLGCWGSAPVHGGKKTTEEARFLKRHGIIKVWKNIIILHLNVQPSRIHHHVP